MEQDFFEDWIERLRETLDLQTAGVWKRSIRRRIKQLEIEREPAFPYEVRRVLRHDGGNHIVEDCLIQHTGEKWVRIQRVSQ